MIWLKATVAFLKKGHYASHFAVGDMPVSLDMEWWHTPKLAGLNLKLAAKRQAQTTDLTAF